MAQATWADDADRRAAEDWPADVTRYWVLFDADDVRAVSEGRVPEDVQARFKALLTADATEGD